MNLYDIHTHNSSKKYEDSFSKKNTINILNVYPFDFEHLENIENFEWFSCGIHPWYSDDIEYQLKLLRNIVKNNCVVAIGEAGFDKLRGPEFSIQRRIFEAQVGISEHCNKPLIIHCVKAWEELLATKKKYNPTQPWIIHGYRGKIDLTLQLIAYGFMFSIGGQFNTESLQKIPVGKLFCETDNSNISIKDVYLRVSETLNIHISTLAKIIENNVKQTFININM